MIDKVLKALTSKVQARMLALLKDAPRTPAELQECLQDDLSEPGTVYVHVYNIRVKLQPFGLDLATVTRPGSNGKRESVYQLVQVPLNGVAPPVKRA